MTIGPAPQLRVISASDVTPAEVPGHSFRVLADAESTSGRYSLTEATSPPAAFVPPHVHHRAVECFYVMDGEYRLTVSGRIHEARAGQFVLVPRGAAHQFRVEGRRPGRAVVIFSPAGFERVFRTMPEIFGTPGEPGPLWARLNADHDTDLLDDNQPVTGGPAAIAGGSPAPRHRLAPSQDLALPGHTRTGLAIRHVRHPRHATWDLAPAVSAVWILAGSYHFVTTGRLETTDVETTASTGQLVTFTRAVARGVGLTHHNEALVLSYGAGREDA
jgi:mannose-6-phosphate isomerase-like protein (cupin superfamily)